MALFRGIQEYIALDAKNITLVFDSGNIINISGNIFLYLPQVHPILYNYHTVFLVLQQGVNISWCSSKVKAHGYIAAGYPHHEMRVSVAWKRPYIYIS